jgi:hypothetical protein
MSESHLDSASFTSELDEHGADVVATRAGPAAVTARTRRGSPRLSAVVVVGPERERGQRVLDALCAQTCADAMELVVVDLAAASFPRLACSSSARVVYVPCDAGVSFGQGRVVGVQNASSPIVAFIEDHCCPSPTWAEALMAAHEGPWGAVGYSFTIANSDSYITRALGIIEYGPWLAPMRSGQIDRLPSHNVSYKRDLLVSLGDRLDSFLNPDFNLHVELRRRGLGMFLEADAVAAHESPGELRAFLGIHWNFMRLLGARRVESHRWSRARRLFYGLAAPLGVPAVTAARYLTSMAGRPALWTAVLASMPIYLLFQVAAGCAEAAGYLWGAGSSEERLTRGELEVMRAPAR